MRKATISLALPLAALAGAAFASPALANEARIEARTGVVWNNSDTDATAGAAAGYDVDLGDKAFIGAEVSADKVLRSDTRVQWGFGGRLGLKTQSGGKAYALAAYETKPCAYCEDSVAVGGGYQQDIGKKYYAKVEYRHSLIDDHQPDSDSALVGVGVKF